MDHQPNKVAYVTGSSRGIGLALCQKLLAEGYHVIGIARGNELTTENFHFQSCDLSVPAQVEQIQFDLLGTENTLLVNNAGMIGEISPVGTQDSSGIEKVHQVNTIAPQILMNSFIKATKQTAGKKHILNISSGAGKYAIDAWSVYCSSKAALDLYSAVVEQEMISRGDSSYKIHSVSPGVVDTQMQSEIREADPNDFLESSKFHDLKQNNQLSSPIIVADKLYQIISDPGHFPNILVSLRDF